MSRGFRGAEADKPGFDASAFWARGGACHAFTRPGQQPTSPRPAFGDHSGSMALAFGISAALYRRAVTGEPTVVENSLLSTAVWMLSSDVTYSQMPGYDTHGMGAVKQPLKYAYTTKDGRIIQFMLLDPRPHWGPLCRMLGLDGFENDPRFVDNEARMKNADELIGAIQGVIGAKDWEEWRPVFDQWDAPWELIRTIEDLSEDPQVLANGMVFNMAVNGGEIRMVAGPTGFDGRAAPETSRPAPALGAHTEELLVELGYSPAVIADLRERKVAE